MRWINVTCDKSEWIIPAQKELFKKYAPGVDLEYITTGSMPLNQWCKTVHDQLPDDKFIIFGLDDYMPIDYFKLPRPLYAPEFYFARLGLGYTCARTANTVVRDNLVEFTEDSPYQVSCQFSIWRTESLKRVLREIDGTPWEFEVQGRCKTYAFKKPVFRWIEESSLSGRQKGKVNLLGLKKEDIDNLIEKQLIPKDKIIYGWKGATEPTKELYGPKYGEYYI